MPVNNSELKLNSTW